MKNLWILILLTAFIPFTSCDKDGEGHNHNDDTETEYHAHIMKPADMSEFMVGDTMHLHIDFEEHTGKTIHHVSVIISKKDGDEIIYNKPNDKHIMEDSGSYEYHDDFVLDVDGHSDWILEAKIWGHEAGSSEVVETIGFHVHPN